MHWGKSAAGIAVAALLGAVLVAAVWFGLFKRAQKPSDQGLDKINLPGSDKVQRLVEIGPGFVGPQACGECHAARLAEFQDTRHYAACVPAKDEPTPPGFMAGKNVFHSAVPGLQFEMTRLDGDLMMNTSRKASLDGAGTAGDRSTQTKIAFVYGAHGVNDEVYFSSRDGLWELPLAWLYPRHEWGESHFSAHATGDCSRELTTKCLECHNTWFKHVAGTLNRYRMDQYVLGVTCERCHGPGLAHAEHHQQNSNSDMARYIIHPGKMSRDRQLDLCAQCHGNALKHRRPAFSYRPGDRLDDYFRTSVHAFPELDSVANQSQYLRESKCFQASDHMTCTTCHNPHHVNRPAEVRAACASCHQPKDCSAQSRLPEAVRDRCASCHMPEGNKVQVNFNTETDKFVPPVRRFEHRIGVYPFAEQHVLLAWYTTQQDSESQQKVSELTESLFEFWSQQADQLQQQFRFLPAIDACRRGLELREDEALRARLQDVIARHWLCIDGFNEATYEIAQGEFDAAIARLESILDTNPQFADAHGRLGTLYAVKKRNDDAVQHLEAVAKYDPNSAYGHSMLGWLAFLDDRPEDALRHYVRADEAEPFNAQIHHQIGLAQAKLGKRSEALTAFEQSLEIDPSHKSSHHAMASLLTAAGRPAAELERAIAGAENSNFRDPDSLLTTAQAYARLGHLRIAVAVGTRAIDEAAQRRPETMETMQRLVDGWQAQGDGQ